MECKGPARAGLFNWRTWNRAFRRSMAHSRLAPRVGDSTTRVRFPSLPALPQGIQCGLRPGAVCVFRHAKWHGRCIVHSVRGDWYRALVEVREARYAATHSIQWRRKPPCA